MKSVLIRRLCLPLALASTQLGSVPVAYAVAENWQVGRIAGRVWIDRLDGERANLVLGMEVEPGVTVFTADHATVTLLRGAETMAIGPKSIVGVSEHPTEGLSTTILERAGSVEFDVERQNVKHFSVETPMLAAVVKGTHFRVSVNRKDGGVSVSRGTVQVTALASGQATDVTVGQQARVASRGSLSVRGAGRAPSITVGAPRAPIVAPIGAVSTLGAAITSFTPAELAAVATVSGTQPTDSLTNALASRAEGPSNAASHSSATASVPSASSGLAKSGGLLAAIANLSSTPPSPSASAGRPTGPSASSGTGAAQAGPTAAAGSPAAPAASSGSSGATAHGHGHGWGFGWGRNELSRIEHWANAVAHQVAASQGTGVPTSQNNSNGNGQGNGVASSTSGPGNSNGGNSSQGSNGGNGNSGPSRGGGWSGRFGSRGSGPSGGGLGVGNRHN